MDENSGTFGSKELASPRRIGLVDLNNERGAGMVTNKQVLELDMVLGKYVGSSNGMMPPQEAERRAARTARVSRFAKFSYGLARNIGIIRPAVQAYQEAMRLDEVEAYQGAVKALQSEKLEGEEFEKRLTELNKEHDVDGLNKKLQDRQKELLDADAGVTLYRMPVTQIPGWNDAEDLPEEQRNGVVDPVDLAVLLDAGVLYDPADEQK